MNNKHPTQPIINVYGVARFKENEIVSYILDRGGIDLNHLAMLPFSNEDRMQFAQLIGYSVSGYGELDYVSDKNYEKVYKKYQKRVTKGDFG